MRGGQEAAERNLRRLANRVLELYQQMDAGALKGAQPGWRNFRSFSAVNRKIY